MNTVITQRRPWAQAAATLCLSLCALAVLASAALGRAPHSRTGFHHGVIPATSGVVQGTPSSNSFTVETRSGTTITVDVASTTTYLERGVASPALSDVGTGDLVAVFGTLSGTTVSAAEVVIRTQTGSSTTSTPVGAGIVTGTPGTDSFVIETRSGTTETVDVSSSTTYSERGVSSPSLADLAANDFVVVYGTLSGSTISATNVVIGGERPWRAFRVAGAVASTPTADAFTITTRSGATETVDVSSTTQYFERGVTGADLTDVATGDYVAVFGTFSGSTVTASRILIIPAPPTSSTSGSGTSATVGTVQTTRADDTFVIETRSGMQYTVDTSSTTTYTERGSTSASLTNVAVGEEVAVFGSLTGSTIAATQVAIAGVGFGRGPGQCRGGSSSQDSDSGSGPGSDSSGGGGSSSQGSGSSSQGGGAGSSPQGGGAGSSSQGGGAGTGSAPWGGDGDPGANAGTPTTGVPSAPGGTLGRQGIPVHASGLLTAAGSN